MSSLKGFVHQRAEEWHGQDTNFIFYKKKASYATEPSILIIGKEGAEPRVLTGEDLDEVRKAFEFIKEIGQRPDNTITTKAHRIEQMVKWANHGLASLPTP